MRKHSKQTTGWQQWLAALTVTIVLLGCNTAQAQEKSLELTTDTEPLPRELKQKTSHSEMLKGVTHSVVNIFTTKLVEVPQMPQFNHPFDRLFPRPFGGDPRRGDPRRGPQEDEPQSRRQSSLGSGVILTSDGYIVTNNHVIAEADEIKVMLANSDREYTAEVIGTDPKTDIALLKVDAEDLPAITVSTTEHVEVGDLVFTIGNPFGVGQTVTSGIVSAIGRGGLGITDYEDFIQTDASINPGNSGGALVDAQGRLIGINTAILSRTGGNQGIGFAVPIDLAQSVMERLVKYGRVVRGFLGVVIQPVTPELAQQFDLESTRGALVGDVTRDGAAQEAGIRSGDVIVEFDGRQVDDVRHLRLMVARTSPDTKTEVKVVRRGKVRTFDVKLKEMPDQPMARDGWSEEDEPASRSVSGIELQDLDRQIRDALSIPQNLEGVLVAAVERNSAAAEAGLRRGDVILQVNHRDVEDVRNAYEQLSKVDGDTVLLYVWSQGSKRYVAVDLRN